MDDDPLSLRLGDLKPHETIVVRCRCGRSAEFLQGYLQKKHRIPSNVLVYDLKFRLKCQQCGAEPVKISITDERQRSHRDQPERIVYGAEKPPKLRLVE
jgi:hypothetical protein